MEKVFHKFRGAFHMESDASKLMENHGFHEESACFSRTIANFTENVKAVNSLTRLVPTVNEWPIRQTRTITR